MQEPPQTVMLLAHQCRGVLDRFHALEEAPEGLAMAGKACGQRLLYRIESVRQRERRVEETATDPLEITNGYELEIIEDAERSKGA